MIIEPPKTLEDFKRVRDSIIDLMKNPWIESYHWHDLKKKLEAVEEKINTLNTTT